MTLYSDILKELRRDKGLTQADIAKCFGISQTMYSMYESGRRTMKIEMLCELADILETSTDYILGRTARQKPYPKRWFPRLEYRNCISSARLKNHQTYLYSIINKARICHLWEQIRFFISGIDKKVQFFHIVIISWLFWENMINYKQFKRA